MASPQNVMALLLFATLTLCTGQQEQPLNIIASPSGEVSVLPGESAFISMLLCPASQHLLTAKVSYDRGVTSTAPNFDEGKDLSYYETEIAGGFLITIWTSVSPDGENCTEMIARIINTPSLRSNDHDHITFTFEVREVTDPIRRRIGSRTFAVTLLSPTPTTTPATTPPAPTTPATTAATSIATAATSIFSSGPAPKTGDLPQSSTILLGVAGAVLLVVILAVATLVVVLRRRRGKPSNEEAQIPSQPLQRTQPGNASPDVSTSATTMGQQHADTAAAT